MKPTMTWILALATLLGGVAAIPYLWGHVRPLVQRFAVHPTTLRGSSERPALWRNPEVVFYSFVAGPWSCGACSALLCVLFGPPPVELLGRPHVVAGPLTAMAAWTMAKRKLINKSKRSRTRICLTFLILALLLALLAWLSLPQDLRITDGLVDARHRGFWADFWVDNGFFVKDVTIALCSNVAFTCAVAFASAGFALLFNRGRTERGWSSSAALVIVILVWIATVAVMPFSEIAPILKRWDLRMSVTSVGSCVAAVVVTRRRQLAAARMRIQSYRMLFAASVLFLVTVWTARLSDIPMILLDDAGVSDGVLSVAFFVWTIVPAGIYGIFSALATSGLLYLSGGRNREGGVRRAELL